MSLSFTNFAMHGCSQRKKPNIIFIMADDLGYGDLGCYGQDKIKTPNLDDLAAEGIRFTQHYAGSTVCAPSRCCLMTGLHSGHAKVRGNALAPLNDTDTTVADVLQKYGYRTGLIGKWGLGEAGSTGIPTKQGFDYFFGYLNQVHAHNYYTDYLWRNEEKVTLKNKVKYRDSGFGSAAEKRAEYSHDLFTEEALDFIEQNQSNPFFLYLALTIPHANNESWLVKRHGMEVPDYGQYADKDWPEPQKGTAAMISRMDRDIGQIVEKIKTLGLENDTYIFFTSDNGPHAEGQNDPDFFDSNGPFRGIKRDLYDGGIRVPLIVWAPGKIIAGRTSEHISAFWDFLPTACDIAGIEKPENIDGLSLLPELFGEKQPKHEYLYWEFFEQGGKQAIRWGDWKAIRLNMHENPEGSLELYNLKNDLSEENNVAAEYPEIVQQAEQILKKARVPSDLFQFKFEKAGE